MMVCPSLVRVLPLLLLIGFTTTTIATDYPYQAVENIAVDCGSIFGDEVDAKIVGGRSWSSDQNNSENFALIEPSTSNMSVISTASQPPNGLNVPYLTARISRSQFTYSFPVSQGQKFIRLHFYPTDTYPGFERDPAFFSVRTGRGNHFTLLNNFTGEPWNHVGESAVYFREFAVNVGEDENKLNITFTPSSAIPKAYAFVNGIEVVSMPTSLYYTGETLYLVGDSAGGFFSVENDTALELMFRVNVGGGYIAPSDDTGMFRTWEQDEPYADNPLFIPFKPVDDNNSITLNFTSNAKNYTAPRSVYTTAQAMGNNKTNNERYNLTWRFPVDSGFTYLIRLHFCQLIDTYGYANAVVFTIYIGTFVAEAQMDVVMSAGGLGVPLYRDYPMMLPGGSQKTTKVNLSVELHPYYDTDYSDPFLNGVEIFKASDGKGDLAGIRFYPSQPNPNAPAGSLLNPPHPSPISKHAIVSGVVFVVVCLLVAALIILFRKLRKKKRTNGGKSHQYKQNHNLLPSSEPCRRFSLSEIKAATNNFNQEFIIGVGGFGSVYRGLIDNGATIVAIKRLKEGSEQGANEFRMEIETLSRLRHVNLVSLLGYCDKKNEMILVYDYMSGGTLRDHLYNTVKPPLSWERRLQICIGAARGLQYLHSGVKGIIIHRDVKTTNILLNEKWVAKVSDFGLSRVSPSTSSITHVSTMVKGSFGYMDPEYYHLQHLTQKSDVYSLGVVLCEVLCARPAIIRSEVDNPVSLAMLFRSSYRSGSLNKIIDPYLIGKIAPECLQKYAEVAFSCISESGVNRPSTSDVLWGLELALQLQDPIAKELIIEMKARNGCNSQEEEELEAKTKLAKKEIPFKARLIYG